jgi:hypothetical protein
MVSSQRVLCVPLRQASLGPSTGRWISRSSMCSSSLRAAQVHAPFVPQHPRRRRSCSLRWSRRSMAGRVCRAARINNPPWKRGAHRLPRGRERASSLRAPASRRRKSKAPPTAATTVHHDHLILFPAAGVRGPYLDRIWRERELGKRRGGE